MLEIKIKSFQQLTTQELYFLLQLRSDIFVVEQECIYQDMDGKDFKALHVLGFKSKKIIAYTRIFKPGDYFEQASIGRVLVAKTERAYKYGNEIMNASIKAIQLHYSETAIHISAQYYLKNFYYNLGFRQVGEKYLEDGIPHVKMLRI